MKADMEALEAKLGPYIRKNGYWVQVSNLVADAKFVHVNPVDQDLLRTEFNSLRGERDGMLPTADRLDVQEAQLLERKEKLEAEKAALNGELADYNSQVKYHNSKCNPAPDDATYRWCVQDKQRLDGWKAGLEPRLRSLSDRIKQWNTEAQNFVDRFNAMVKMIREWETKVQNLIERIQRALDKIEKCLFTSRATNGLCIYNCEKRGVTYLPPEADDKCADPRFIPVLGDGLEIESIEGTK